MSRKDMLAAGARKATFAGGSGDSDIFRNVAKDESEPESIQIEQPVVKAVPRKKFLPANDTLLVRRSVVEKSSVLITDTMEQEAPAEGFVLEAGPNTDYPVGSHVVFGKYSGTEFKLNGEVLLLMPNGDITGTLVDETEIEIPVAGICIASA